LGRGELDELSWGGSADGAIVDQLVDYGVGGWLLKWGGRSGLGRRLCNIQWKPKWYDMKVEMCERKEEIKMTEE
jgi:hypothetical protein